MRRDLIKSAMKIRTSKKAHTTSTLAKMSRGDTKDDLVPGGIGDDAKDPDLRRWNTRPRRRRKRSFEPGRITKRDSIA